MEEVIKIGTRGSMLALWQAKHISQCLQNEGLKTEIVIIHTKGDLILDKSLSKIGSKGLFTAELEEALTNKEIHIAVHSAKDMPTSISNGLEIISYTKREIVNDALISNKNVTLNDQITVGTSSTRRVALLKHYYPHIKIVDMRGNLQTRVKKMEEGQCDALLLAFAGAHRMDFGPMIKQKISDEIFIPAVGQGTLAIEASTSLDINIKNRIIKATQDIDVTYQLRAETSFLKLLNGGCSVPVFALAKTEGDNITITGGVISLNGDELIKETCHGLKINALEVGKELYEKVKIKGGIEILNEIKKVK